MLEFDNGEYESVCIFAEKTDDRDGWICLEGPGGKEQQVHMNDDWYRLVQLALPEKGIYRISRKGVSFTQMYLSGGPDLMDRGIRFLDPDSGDEMELGNGMILL